MAEAENSYSSPDGGHELQDEFIGLQESLGEDLQTELSGNSDSPKKKQKVGYPRGGLSEDLRFEWMQASV